MSNRGQRKQNTIFGWINIKRCMFCALLSVAIFPVMLLLAVFQPEMMREYLMPGAFFAAGSVAFAYLFFQIMQRKAREYYDIMTWSYLIYFHLFLTYFSGKSIMFYYAAVLITSYTVFLPLGQYVAVTLGELAGYAWMMMLSGAKEISATQVIILIAVHAFAFISSRENYTLRKNYLAEEKKLRRERREAERDPLTGLMNRRGLERHVEELWSSCIRNRDTVAAFVMDIDLFKSYNDRFGHVQGDVCIQKVARCIEDTVKGFGIVARIGGEEFLVFVRGQHPQDIYELAEQIRFNVERMGISRGMSNRSVVTISIGVDMTYAADDTTLQGLYGRADKQLYIAKQDGRNCVRAAHFRDRKISKIV